MRLAERCVGAVGIFIGTLLAVLSVLLLQGRVLRVEVTGSGAYLAPEVRAILGEEGVGMLSKLGDENSLVPRLLSLPRVHFCSVKGEGGVLTVRLEVGDETEPIRFSPLTAPSDGRVEELVVISGRSLAAIGDEVKAGQLLVESEGDGIVIARVRISYPFSAEYALEEEGAVLQASLEFGEIGGIHTTRTADGWRVEGTAYVSASQGLG